MSLMPRCWRKKPFLLYHWSPSSRRAAIQREGLVIGSPVVIHSAEGWTPTYLCFSDSPSFAWGYSGALSNVAEDWDLWQVWSDSIPGGVFIRSDHVGCRPAEYRAKSSIPKDKLWFVATRNHTPRKRRK